MRTFLLTSLIAMAITSSAMACGRPSDVGHPFQSPELAKALDAQLPRANLTPQERNEVLKLRAEIETFHGINDEKKARALEEQAMLIMGFGKLWYRCGEGVFAWHVILPSKRLR